MRRVIIAITWVSVWALFWGVAAFGVYPGIKGAFDNRVSHSDLTTVLLKTLLLIVIAIGASTVPSSLSVIKGVSGRPSLAIAFAAGTAIGACFVLSSLLIGPVWSIASAYPRPLVGLVGHRPWPGAIWWSTAVTSIALLALGAIVGLGVGLVTALGFGQDLARVAFASRWRGVVVSTVFAVVVIVHAIVTGVAAARGRGIFFPHYAGLAVGVAEGISDTMYPLGIAAGLLL